jgi:cell division protein FtsL
MREAIKTKIKCKNLLVLSVCFFVISLMAQLYVSNRLVVRGKEMVDLAVRREDLEKEISELSLEQSQRASLSSIEERANKLGFVESTEYVSAIASVTTTAAVPTL